MDEEKRKPWQKLCALLVGLVVLLVGLLLCRDNAHLSSLYIPFSSALVLLVSAYITGNVMEHKAMVEKATKFANGLIDSQGEKK